MQEFHHILRADSVAELISLERSFLSGNSGWNPVFRRYLLSSADQESLFDDTIGAVSFIVQPPLDGSAVAVWLYLVKDAGVEYGSGRTVVQDRDCEYFWYSSCVSADDGPEEQTRRILEGYEASLADDGMNVRDNCVRTWFFVHDIDRNYSGLVKARRENFETEGLTPRTHYIASTGICGSPCAPGSVVQMDALAMRGRFTQTYLYAPTHLNPTYEYGVTFERGVRVDSDGLSRTYISGTASINNRGEVVHVGDVAAQTGRMLENIDVLLDEAGACWDDVRMALVYLRNAGDYGIVAPLIAGRLPGVPYVILLAPVCRPDWLVEMECIASRRK